MDDLIRYFSTRIDDLSFLQLVLLVAFFLISSVGVNLVFLGHMRRVNAAPSSFWNPFRLMAGFNRTEWTRFIAAIALAAACGVIAMIID